MLGKNERLTGYSKWYCEWVIWKGEEPREIEMVWDEKAFDREMWHSKYWFERRREKREMDREDVGPMGEKL